MVWIRKFFRATAWVKGWSHPATSGLRAFAILSSVAVTGCSDAKKISEVASGGSASTSSPLTLQILESPTTSIGFIGVGGSKFFRLTIQTTGQGTASVDAFSNSDSQFTFNGGSFPGTGGTCTTPITGNCSLGLLFTPTGVGSFANNVSVTYTNSAGTSTVSTVVSAQATIAAALLISDGVSYDFGIKTILTSTEKTFTVTNLGGIAASDLAGSGLAAPYSFKGGSYPGTGGTCGNTLGIGDSCTIVVTYAPTAAGVTNDQIVIDYQDGNSVTSATRDVTGTAQGLAALTISDGATYNYGNVIVGATPAEKTFTVSNAAGSATAESISGGGLASPFEYKGGAYPGTGGDCGSTLAGGASCTIVVTYTPLAVGGHADTIELTYDNDYTTVTSSRAVQGTGVNPGTLVISDATTYDFGSTAVGAFLEKTFTVDYTGTFPVTAVSGGGLAAPFTFKGGAYPGTGGTCGTTIAADCTIVVRFAPTAAGLVNDVIELSYNDGTTTPSVTALRPIQGTGLTVATLTISDAATYNFGSLTVGETADHTFNVSYSGGTPATAVNPTALAAPYSFKGGGYPGTGGTCGTTINANCTIVVTYSPTTAGTHNRTLTLSYNNGATTTTANRAMTGTATAAASLTISDGATYNYGNVATGATAIDKSFTISNTGGSVQATGLAGSGLAAPFEFKGGTYPGTGGNCGTTLNGGASCTIVVSYAPTTLGTHSDTIVIDYDNGVTTTSATRPIQGTGIAPASLTLSDGATYDFGNVAVGGSAEKVFTVSYTGAVAATSVSEIGLAAPFAFKGGSFPGTGGTCGTTIAADCTIVVSFSPTAAGLASDTIALSYNTGATTATAFRAVQGTGQAVATLAISDAATYDFGSFTAGESADHTFTVTYTGDTAATAVNPVVLTPPYSYKGGSFPGTGGTCGTTISSSCSVVVTFAPTAGGTFNQTFSLDYNDGVNAQSASRAMTGTGLTPATLTISDGPEYDFGNRTLSTSTDKSFTVSNTGQTDATTVAAQLLSAPFSFKDGTYPGTGGNCGATITAGANCTVVVTFNPTVAGGYAETLQLDYDDGATAQSATRSIVGTGGAVANLSISDGPTYSFGTVAVSYSADYTFTVTNVGGSSATAISETTLTAPFAFKGGAYPGTGGDCGTSLGTGASCTLVVTYSPTAATSSSGTITLSYQNGTAAATSERDVAGVGATITQIVAGAEHTCALYSTGIVRCWGSDSSGQLGNDAAFASSSAPVTVSGISNATKLAAGANHTCALLSTNRIYCWGSDSDGQLGNGGGNTSSGVPVQVSTYTDFMEVAAGGNNTCGVRTNEAAYCWGDDSLGQLGNGGANADATTPSAVSGLGSGSDVDQLAVGAGHACARLNTGALRCWGSDSNGQLGDAGGSGDDSNTPVNVNGYASSGADAIAAGGTHTCILTSSNTTRCFGSDTYGELGNSATLTDASSPSTVTGAAGATALALGTDHTCALVSNDVKCWGRDDEGQLGDNSPSANEAEPVDVAGLSNVTAIAAGGKHSCAVQSSGEVYCWGQDSAGQLGNGAGSASQGTPDLVQGL